MAFWNDFINQPLLSGVLFVYGLVLGSFLNVVILRLPLGRRLSGRSICGNCNRRLKPADMVPVLSFLMLKGRCRQCGASFSWRYAAIEFVTGILFAAAGWRFFPVDGIGWLVLLEMLILISIMLVVFFVDLDHMIILDHVLLFGAAVFLLLNLARSLPGWVWDVPGNIFLTSLLTAALCFLPFFVIWFLSQGRWMGFGDVKLAPVLGLALGWPEGPLTLFLAVLLGGLVGVGLLAFTDKTMKSRIPFGTFLSAAAVLSAFFGRSILGWYLSVLGL